MRPMNHDEELTGFQTGFALRPAAVFAASSADDVITAVRYAAAKDLPVGVQATGHGLPGPMEGGVLITTKRMDQVTVDPDSRTVRVQAGVRWSQVVAAAEPYREGRFLVRLLTMGEREKARVLLDPAFALLAPTTTGRALNFAFGAGERTEGLYDAETRKRLAGLKSQYDPANLFRNNYSLSAC
nr:FAD-dependent oxidoreductase [Streptomyces fulvoviolaceus]